MVLISFDFRVQKADGNAKTTRLKLNLSVPT